MVAWAALLAVVAIGLAIWQSKDDRTLLEFALGVMSYAYAGLLGVFLVALFTRRGSAGSVVAALVVGGLAILAPGPVVVWSIDADWMPRLALGWRMTIAVAVATVVAGWPSGGAPAAERDH